MKQGVRWFIGLAVMVTIIITTGIAWADVRINSNTFPDDNFRSLIEDYDEDGDGILSDVELDDITFLECSSCMIADLTGIEHFTALEWLDCSDNEIIQLDLSKNTSLRFLNCSENRLENLDVSNCTDIATLVETEERSYACYIDEDDDYWSEEYDYWGIYWNYWGYREEESGNTLEYLQVDSEVIVKAGDFISLPNEYMTIAENHFPDSHSEDEAWPREFWLINDYKQFPDERFRAYIAESYDENGDGYLDPNETAAVSYMNVSGAGISNLKGIEYFTALTQLYCGGNQLTSLDVSKNTALTELVCDDNQLTSLDLSKNTALTYLNCKNNKLTSLVASKNTALVELYCYNNQLISLDVSNLQELTRLDCSRNKLKSLYVSSLPELTRLDCSCNSLESLDVNNNQKLIHLDCRDNHLSSLDVRDTQLVELHCTGNIMSITDISLNSFLDWMSGQNLKKSEEEKMDLAPNNIRISDGLYYYELRHGGDEAYWGVVEYTGEYLPCFNPDDKIAEELKGFPVWDISSNIYSHLNRESGNYLYAPVSETECYLTGYKGYERIAYLPSEIDGYQVIGIADYAFMYAYDFAEIVIVPSSVKYIGKGAFCLSNCKCVILQEGIEEIGDAAFLGLPQIYWPIPASVRKMGTNPFADQIDLGNTNDFLILSLASEEYFGIDDDLLYSKEDMRVITYLGTILPEFIEKSVVVPEGIRIIGASAFYDAEHLTQVILPDSLEEIEGCAFLHCQNLTNVIIPDHVASIGDSAFSETSIKVIHIPANVTEIGSDIFSWYGDDPGPDITIICAEGSAAEAYALKHGHRIEYEN